MSAEAIPEAQFWVLWVAAFVVNIVAALLFGLWYLDHRRSLPLCLFLTYFVSLSLIIPVPFTSSENEVGGASVLVLVVCKVQTPACCSLLLT